MSRAAIKYTTVSELKQKDNALRHWSKIMLTDFQS